MAAKNKKQNAKEIMIALGYDISKFKQESAAINAEINKTSKSAKTLEKELKLNYSNDTFLKAQSKAEQAVSATQKKVKLLKEHLDKLDKNSSSEIVRQEYEKLSSILEDAEYKAEQARQQLERINNIKLDRLQEQISSAGNELTSIGSKLTLGLTTPLVAAGAAAYNYSADTQEAINKAQEVFGQCITQIEKLAKTSLEQYGLSKQTIYNWTSLYGDMGTAIGQTKQEAAEMSVELTKRLVDIISFKNLSASAAETIGKALYSGESEPLKNIGVVMTETTLKAYAAAEGYNKLYTEMSQLEKLQVRIAYFMDATKNATGDFARTADSASNQMKIAKERLKELASNFGETLAPAITPLIANLNNLLEKFAGMSDGAKQNVIQFAAFAAMLGPLTTLIGGVTKAANTGISAYRFIIAKKQEHAAATAAETATETANTAAKQANAAATTADTAATAANTTAQAAGAATEAVDAAATTANTTATGAATVAETANTAATTANTAAKEANVVATAAATGGLSALISVIGVATAAIAAFALSSSMFGDSADDIADSVSTVNKAYENFQKNLKNTKNTFAESSNEAETTAKSLNILTDKLFELYSRSERTAGTQKQMQAIVEQLNEGVNGLNLTIDKNTGNLNLNEQAIRKTIAAQKEMMLNNAYTKYAQETADSLAEAEVNLEKLLETYGYTLDQTDEFLAEMHKQDDKIKEESFRAHLNATRMGNIRHPKINNEALNALNKYHKYVDDIKKLQEELDRVLSKSSETSVSDIINITPDTKDYETEKKNLEYRYKIGAILTEKYFAELIKLRNEYLERGTDEWKDATVEIFSLESRLKQEWNQQKQEAAQALKDAYSEQKNIASYNHQMGISSDEAYYKKLSELRDKYLTKDTADWRSATLELKNLQESTTKEKYESAKSLAEYYHEMQIYSDKVYYKKLTELRDTYLKKDTADWRNATLTLKRLQEQMQQDAAKAAEDAAKEEKNAQKQALSDYKDYVNEQIKLARKQADEKISLIDAEIAARKELREQDKIDKKLAQAEAKLKYEKDETNRKELEKEIARLKGEIEDREYEKEMQSRKDAVEKAYEEAEKATQALVDKYARLIGEAGYNYNPTVENFNTSNSATIINQMAGVTAAMVEEIIKKELRAAGVI